MNKLTKLFFIFGLLININAFAKSYEGLRWQTDNGANVVFYQTTQVPMLQIMLAFRAGSAYDKEHFGLSTLTTRLLNQGSAQYDANMIAERLADTGAQFSSNNNRDMIVLSLKTLVDADTLKKSLDTFNLIVNKPNFAKDAFVREKDQQLSEIEAGKESPKIIADETFYNALYGDHPYSHPVSGTKNTVQNITIQNVKDFYKEFFTAKNAYLVLVGDIDAKKARTIAQKITKKLPKGNTIPTIAEPAKVLNPKEYNIDFPSTQTILVLGQLGIDYKDTDYFPLLVGNYLLGGGTILSKLGNEVREKRGLTYGIYSQFKPLLEKGPFTISLSTKNTQVDTALEVIQNTLQSFLDNGVDETDLIAAKQYLTGSFPLSLASNHSIATMLLKIAFYNLPKDYLDTYTTRINALTHAQITKAMQKLIIPKNLLLVAVGSNNNLSQ